MLSPIELAELLDRYLRDVAAQPEAFTWQRRNCCHFVGGWVLRATGRDCLTGLADVADARAARRVLARLGARSLGTAVTARLGWPSRAVALAQVGDVVLIESSPASAGLLGATLGVCNGRVASLLSVEGRLGHLPMDHALASWPLFGRTAQQLGVAA